MARYVIDVPEESIDYRPILELSYNASDFSWYIYFLLGDKETRVRVSNHLVNHPSVLPYYTISALRELLLSLRPINAGLVDED